MSVEEILKPIIEQEFAKYQQNGQKIKLPSMAKTRILYTLCCLLGAWVFFPAALVIYIVLMVRLSKVKCIVKLAKKYPDKPISQIISDEMHSTEGTKIVVGILAVVAGVLISVGVIYNKAVDLIFDGYETQEPEILRSEDNLYAPYGDGYKLVSAGIQYMDDKEIIIPDQYKGLEVVAIGDDAFSGFTDLEFIVIPETVEEIGKRAFQNCERLTSVFIPEGVEIIRGGAFMDCERLSYISLSSTVNEIGGECFKNCYALESIEIPKTVTEIRGNCFENCTALAEVKLHDNIVSIHGYAFRNCSSLTEITLPKKIIEISGNTFEDCTSLKSISIPKGVVRIGGHAFRNCSSLSKVYVPHTVVEIGSSAFRRCDSLLQIEIPRNAVVNERAFKESPTQIRYK